MGCTVSTSADRRELVVEFATGAVAAFATIWLRELLAMHNHRVLHGRRAFDLSTGRRSLLGCYLDVDDLRSAMRTCRRRLEV